MKILGDRGERLAAEYLKKKGLKIIKRNYRTPYGEIDIIARDGVTTVFVEVKTRASSDFASPYVSVDRKKREKIKSVAMHYLSTLKDVPPTRFDVISITMGGKGAEIEHLDSAFGFTE